MIHKERDENTLQVHPFRKSFFEWLGGSHSGTLDLSIDRRLFHPQSDVKGNADQEDRDDEGDAPTPVAERLFTHRVLHDKNDHE